MGRTRGEKEKRGKRNIEGWRIEIKGTIYKHNTKQEFVLLLSPCTVISCDTTASPYSLVATHSYMPASSGTTGEISRAPEEVVKNLSGGKRSGVSPPPGDGCRGKIVDDVTSESVVIISYKDCWVEG